MNLAYFILGRYMSFGLITILIGLLLPPSPRGQDEALPVVVAASVPFYPRAGLLAHINGTVKIQVTTDGKKISSMSIQTGPAILAQAAKDNLQTWQLDEHKPTTFITTFEYALEDPAVCSVENATVVLKMPTYVKVTARRVHTCDPTSDVSR